MMAVISYTQKVSLLLGGRVSIKPTTTVVSSSLQRYFSSSATATATSTTPLSSASPWLMVPPTLIPDWEGAYKRDAKYCPHCKTTVFGSVRPTQFQVKPNSEVKPEDNDYYHFLNAAENKVFKKKKNLWMPWQTDRLSPDEAICIGSSHGWLAYIHSRNCSLYLYNPFIDSSMPYLPLPPIETLPPVMSGRRLNGFHIDSTSSSVVTEFIIWKQMSPISAEDLSDRFFRKLVMSSAPTPFSSNCYENVNQDPCCTIMAIYEVNKNTQRLAFCRIGDASWTALDSPLEGSYDDLLYFSKNKLFYALCQHGCVESWDVTDPSSPKRSLVISTVPRSYYDATSRYLVESSGDLLMVFRHEREHPDDPYDKIMTHKFQVYKLDFVENKWVLVLSLGDRVLFVGQNQSVSLSAHDFPGLTKNSIYFTAEHLDENSWGCYDLGVFNLEDKSLHRFDLKEIQSSPVWVAPQL